MRNFIVAILIFLGGVISAQYAPNAFSNDDVQNESASAPSAFEDRGAAVLAGPGDPGGDDDPLPAPIDGYIPVLITAAVLLIFYQRKRLASTK